MTHASFWMNPKAIPNQMTTSKSLARIRKVARKWPDGGFSTKNPEAFQLRDSLILKEKCSKEDSNLHGLPH